MRIVDRLFGFFVIALILAANFVWAEEAGFCNGDVKLSLYYSTLAKTTISADITGMENCQELPGYISENDCAGQKVCEFEVLTTGEGKCTFPIPKDSKTHLYVVCIDLNGNGIYEENEKDTLIFDLEKGACRSLGCEPTSWSPCFCENGATNGITKGVCIDNCGIEITKEKECKCNEEVTNKTEEDELNNELDNKQESNEEEVSEQNAEAESSENEEEDKLPNPQPSSSLTYYLVGGAILVIVLILIAFLMTRKRPPIETQEKGWESKEIRTSKLE